MDNIKRIKDLNQRLDEILNECPEVVYIGDSILREKTNSVFLQEGLEVSKKLKDTLAKYRDIAGFGRGLAAPQIGESKSVFITFVDDTFKTYINPRIKKSSPKTNFYRESCLSCGYLSVDVKRPEAVEIEYMDEKGSTKNEHLESFVARLVQHEVDHLEGIVNVDKGEIGSIDFMLNDPLKERLRKVK